MPVVDRGFSYHYIYEDLNVPIAGTVVLAHGIDHEPDYAIINNKSGDARLTVNYVDRFEISLTNAGAVLNVSDILLTYWHSVPK